MRGLGFLIVAMLPGVVWAEPVVLRVEARRAAAVAPVAQGWAERFPEVVTFPLPGGWTGIGLGPMEREEAEAELSRLIAADEVPADSFIVPVPEGALPVRAAAIPVEAAGQEPADALTVAPEGAAESGRDDATSASQAGTATEALAPETAAVEPAPVPSVGDYLRLQRFDTREAADAALATWREDFPEAGLFQQPDGGLAIALGPMPAGVAEAWLGAFRTAQRVGRLAAVMSPADLGEPLEPAGEIDLPPPGPAAEMPPLEDVQRALRWAGHYDGEIDGKDGPQTRAAIAAEVLALRASPDPAATMQALIAQREDWRTSMNLTRLDDPQSGLSLVAPMDRLEFDRNEQGLSIYGPKEGSGAALILYGAPGGQQEMLDFTGLVTALGWVPLPERQVTRGRATLIGRNDTHIGQAEARVIDGRVQGVVLIWPVMDAGDQPRVAAEILDSIQVAPAPEDAARYPADPT